MKNLILQNQTHSMFLAGFNKDNEARWTLVQSNAATFTKRAIKRLQDEKPEWMRLNTVVEVSK